MKQQRAVGEQRAADAFVLVADGKGQGCWRDEKNLPGFTPANRSTKPLLTHQESRSQSEENRKNCETLVHPLDVARLFHLNENKKN